jgi:hypothetical protein
MMVIVVLVVVEGLLMQTAGATTDKSASIVEGAREEKIRNNYKSLQC